MIVSLNNVEKSFAENLILSDVCLSVDENDRIGLVGPNGAGKTTLLNILCKRDECDSGDISFKSGLTVGYLEQGSGLSTDNTIIEEMKSVFTELYKIQDKLRTLETKLADMQHANSNYKTVADEYSHLSGYFELMDGYNIEVKIRTVLNGMGFQNKDSNVFVNTLSGGEKTRLALAKLLLEQPDLLILDEPTNHLDFKTLMWLEDYLNTYKGALLLVSHDRYFLDKTVKTIWEISEAVVTVFKGNYSKYKLLREEQDCRQQKEFEQNELKVAKMLEYAQKNIARASTSASAKSRLKQVANMEQVKKPKPAVKPPLFSFVFDREPVKEVLNVEDYDLTVGEEKRLLIGNIEFTIRRNEKVAIIGDNGTGKSTLLKALINAYPRTDNIKWGGNVTVSYYDQENKNLNFNNTLLEELHRHFPMQPTQNMRTLLGSVRITDDNVYKKVSVVSGGERAKLGLALVMAKKANTVVMDEPTNHLDLMSKEALEKALKEFEGTIIFVSHDRYFLNSVPTRIIELTDKSINFYNGGFDFYMEQKQKTSESENIEKAKIKEASKEKDNFYKSKSQRSEEAKRRTRLKQLEAILDEKEKLIKSLEEQISDTDNATDYGKLSELCAHLENERILYDKYIEEWLELS